LKVSTEAWQQKRLIVIRLIARHEQSAKQIAETMGVARSRVFVWRDKFRKGGVKELLRREYKGFQNPLIQGKLKKALVNGLRRGLWRTARQIQVWLKQKTGQTRAERTLRYHAKKLGGALKMPRKAHAQQDPVEVEAWKKTLLEKLIKACEGAKTVHLLVWDEHRLGLIPVIRRVWGLRGFKVTAPYRTKYDWTYSYEALEVGGDNKMHVAYLPTMNKENSMMFLKMIADTDPEARFIMIGDQAGAHPKPDDENLPANVRLIPLPAYSPELNPTEELGDIAKDQICNKVFDKIEDLEDEITKAYAPIWSSHERVIPTAK